tara:strand:- start:797 stop:1555 length:759 start_codon:yes stop_codon:yes gene_type:complete
MKSRITQLALMCGFVFCQVNTEAMRNNKDEDGIINSIGFDFGFEKSNQELVEITGQYRLDYISENGISSFFIINYDNGYEKEKDQKNSIVNKGFSHFRLTKNLSNTLSLEIFSQYGFNDFLLMKERTLFGLGMRYNLIDQKKHKGILGAGLMKEDEKYLLDLNEDKSLLRSTNYFIWQVKFSENASLQNTAYFQFDLSRSSDSRLLYDGDLNIALNDKLSFIFALNYRYDSEPHGDLGKSYIQLKNGIEFIF